MYLSRVRGNLAGVRARGAVDGLALVCKHAVNRVGWHRVLRFEPNSLSPVFNSKLEVGGDALLP